MKISGWDKWQTYRSDRGAPPWIKVHRSLMTNAGWAELTDAEKGQLVSMWVVAADKSGEVPDAPSVLRKVCMLDEEPNINKFIELGFIEPLQSQGDVSVTSAWRQCDEPDQSRVEESRVEERRGEESRGEITPGKPDIASSILDYLNEKTGKAFRAVKSNMDLINSRIREGATEDEMRGVIDRKTREWAGDKKMHQYLRPATLFNATKYNQYAGELTLPDIHAEHDEAFERWLVGDECVEGEVIHE